ncbi:hypothetical protein C7974DRAFT_412273 [Boeremia exigua]|uniref:uncharacterized protein n=1 Tax=Boeremia exigua TaxID=749465 RepID=UPI001E8DFFB4|nr:uncharacterized protein C7974DRAFT_412273 [Boeremia exigua]KAH6633266.1 hypothetical protein C7974DRAFT_412273 [Boeremia exigua]
MSAPNTNKPSKGIVGQIGNSTSNATNYISKASTDNAKAAAKRAKMKEKNNRSMEREDISSLLPPS